jgi:hypothetical protein
MINVADMTIPATAKRAAMRSFGSILRHGVGFGKASFALEAFIIISPYFVSRQTITKGTMVATIPSIIQPTLQIFAQVTTLLAVPGCLLNGVKPVFCGSVVCMKILLVMFQLR